MLPNTIVQNLFGFRDVQRMLPEMQQLELMLHPNADDPSRYGPLSYINTLVLKVLVSRVFINL